MKHPKSYDTDAATRERMSKVKLKGGDAEKQLAKRLWRLGCRYRKNYRRLPGSPDIAIFRYQIAVFIDGEFWHGKDWSIRREKLKRNRDYWIEKIEENIARDARVDEELRKSGWTPIHFWSKDVMKDTDACVSSIVDIISSFEQDLSC